MALCETGVLLIINAAGGDGRAPARPGNASATPPINTVEVRATAGAARHGNAATPTRAATPAAVPSAVATATPSGPGTEAAQAAAPECAASPAAAAPSPTDPPVAEPAAAVAEPPAAVGAVGFRSSTNDISASLPRYGPKNATARRIAA
jgi:hypothetical protein